MAGIGGEFKLAVWQMSVWSAKFKSAKYSATGNFADLVLYAVAAVPDPALTEIAVPRPTKLKSANLKKFGKMTNSPNIIPANISGHMVCYTVTLPHVSVFPAIFC